MTLDREQSPYVSTQPTLLLMEESAEPRPARRGFLRTLITAPAAALATHRLLIAPSLPALTGPSPEERLKRGLAEVEAAFRDMFPSIPLVVRGNILDGGHPRYLRWMQEEEHCASINACVMVMASPGFAGAADRRA